MAVNPITFARVSHNLKTLSLLDSLRRNTMSLFAEQNRLASGNRLNAPSENPVLASRALNLTEILDRQDQLLSNIRHADGFLAATDSAASEIGDLLTQAKSIASDMVNSVVRSDERESQAEIISAIIDQLIAVGNRTYNGIYLFAGKDTLSPPLSRAYGGVAFVGDVTDLRTDVGAAEGAVYNVTADTLFGMTTGRVTGYRDLEPAPTSETRLRDLKGATLTGVRPGRVQVLENDGAVTFTVDLSGAETLGDLADLINAAAASAGSGVTATIGGSGLVLTSGGGQSIEVREVGSGTTAADLGILKAVAAGSNLVGDNIHAKITPTTPVGALAGGAGVDLMSPIQISNGSLSASVDLSGAQTVQDILNAINTADVGVRAVISDNEDRIQIINLVSGREMRIAEQGGTTAESLGIRTLHAGGVLSDLNHGRGVRDAGGPPDFRIVAMDGKAVDVSISGTRTVQDVLDAINSAATAAGAAITASLNPNGPGIRIEDASGGSGTLRVERLNNSFAIDDLGLNVSASPGQTFLVGQDTAGVRPASLFSALVDLEAALRRDDTRGINMAAQELEAFMPPVIRVQGIVGARSKAMRDRVGFMEDAVQATRALLSEVKDLDYTEAVTRFQQAQTALEANLMTGSRMLSISLLDFLS